MDTFFFYKSIDTIHTKLVDTDFLKSDENSPRQVNFSLEFCFESSKSDENLTLALCTGSCYHSGLQNQS